MLPPPPRFLQVKSRENLFFTALRLDRSSFVQTFIKLNFNVAQMFYETNGNRSLKFQWSKLRELYNDKNQVESKKTVEMYRKSTFFLSERSSLSSGQMFGQKSNRFGNRTRSNSTKIDRRLYETDLQSIN